MIRSVILSKRAKKDLLKVPKHIAQKLMTWVESVEADSLEATRKIPGHHDEPLKCDRKGQRSIRLSKAYARFMRLKKMELNSLKFKR
jgi:proteic killer suppression protein